MTATAEPDDAAPLTGEEHKPDFFGHPRGLWYLAFTEAWERFSYYGMQSLLVLYMVNYLLKPGRIEHVAAFASFRKLYFGLDGQALASGSSALTRPPFILRRSWAVSSRTNSSAGVARFCSARSRLRPAIF